VPDAVTDFGEIAPLIVRTCVSTNERAGSCGVVVVVVVVGRARVVVVTTGAVATVVVATASCTATRSVERCRLILNAARAPSATASVAAATIRERRTGPHSSKPVIPGGDHGEM
jgi:hypothetical protein